MKLMELLPPNQDYRIRKWLEDIELSSNLAVQKEMYYLSDYLIGLHDKKNKGKFDVMDRSVKSPSGRKIVELLKDPKQYNLVLKAFKRFKGLPW